MRNLTVQYENIYFEWNNPSANKLNTNPKDIL